MYNHERCEEWWDEWSDRRFLKIGPRSSTLVYPKEKLKIELVDDLHAKQHTAPVSLCAMKEPLAKRPAMDRFTDLAW